METDINDVRIDKDFKDMSFSGYKRADVRKELLENLQKNKIENSCYWSAELVCSGLYMDLWDIILLYTSKYIHVGNPKLPIYIDMRFSGFKEILRNGYLNNELSMRNNEKIRILFSEIISILCLSLNKHSFEKLKVKKIDFDMTNFSEKLKAPNINYISDIFKDGDPKELYIALNEFSYNIDVKNSLQSCWWIEWIIEFECICRKKKEKCEASYRTFMDIENKYQNDIIWIIWEVLLIKVQSCKTCTKILNSLLNLYCIKYTPTVKKKRIYLMYNAVSICCENIDLKIDIFKNKNLIENVCNKTNIVYKEIKKLEKTPNTDYLFNTGKSNVEKTIERLNKMNDFTNVITRK